MSIMKHAQQYREEFEEVWVHLHCLLIGQARGKEVEEEEEKKVRRRGKRRRRRRRKRRKRRGGGGEGVSQVICSLLPNKAMHPSCLVYKGEYK